MKVIGKEEGISIVLGSIYVNTYVVGIGIHF